MKHDWKISTLGHGLVCRRCGVTDRSSDLPIAIGECPAGPRVETRPSDDGEFDRLPQVSRASHCS